MSVRFFICRTGTPVMPKLSSAQQEQRRTRILDAAEICFANNGFHRTTIQDICREAGVSAGALYLYFNAKEDLIEGISSRLRDEVLASFTRLAEAEDFTRGLEQALDECILGQPLHKARLLVDIGAESARNEAVARTMRRCDELLHEALTAVLERAAAAGRIAPVLPVAEIVGALGVLGDGLFWRRAVQPDLDLRAFSTAVMAMVNALVRPQSVAPMAAREGAADNRAEETAQ